MKAIKITYLKKLILLFAISMLFDSCKKEGKGCWQAFNPQGYDEPGLVVCDKTKAEAEVAYPSFWFYRIGEKKYCWQVQFGTNSYRTWDVPESMVKKTMEYNGAYHFTKIDCNSFCFCEWHEKHKSKITGLYDPTKLITETLLSADSCSKLSVGRVVTVRETADSLITRELTKKHP
jgi:hypothetical protein